MYLLLRFNEDEYQTDITPYEDEAIFMALEQIANTVREQIGLSHKILQLAERYSRHFQATGDAEAAEAWIDEYNNFALNFGLDYVTYVLLEDTLGEWTYDWELSPEEIESIISGVESEIIYADIPKPFDDDFNNELDNEFHGFGPGEIHGNKKKRRKKQEQPSEKAKAITQTIRVRVPIEGAPPYKVVLTRKALKAESKMPTNIVRVWIRKKKGLSENPYSNDGKLTISRETGKTGSEAVWKLYIGKNWRALFNIQEEEKMVTVFKLGTREDFYKDVG